MSTARFARSAARMLAALLLLGVLRAAEAEKAAASEPHCRIDFREAPLNQGTESLGDLTCAEGETLMAADLLHTGSMLQCNSRITKGKQGVSTVNATCIGGGGGAWIARLSCCKLTGPAAARISCETKMNVSGIDRRVPASWRKICCKHGTVVSAQSYIHQTGRGNCPVRIVPDGPQSCAAVGDCGLPAKGTEWVLDMVCCSEDPVGG